MKTREINETERPHEEELKIVQEESFSEVEEFNRSNSDVTLASVGHGYNDYEINECGTEMAKSAAPSSLCFLPPVVVRC